MPIGLVLADDHPIILKALDGIFSYEKDVTVLARCLTGHEAIEAVRQHRPDILILDLALPDIYGLEVMRRLKQEGLPTKVVLLTAALDESQAIEAIRLGVRGVVLKEMSTDFLLPCVRRVHAGGQWIEKRSFVGALEKMLQREAGVREASSLLTAREMAILRMVAQGLRNKEVAASLHVSEGTVKTHLHHIFEKIRVRSRTELIRWAMKKGLVQRRAGPWRRLSDDGHPGRERQYLGKFGSALVLTARFVARDEGVDARADHQDDVDLRVGDPALASPVVEVRANVQRPLASPTSAVPATLRRPGHIRAPETAGPDPPSLSQKGLSEQWPGPMWPLL